MGETSPPLIHSVLRPASSYVDPDHPNLLLLGCCVAGASVFIVPPSWIFSPPEAQLFGAEWSTVRFLASIWGVVNVLLLIVGGLLGDYFGRRRFLLLGLLLSALAHGMLLFVTSQQLHVALRILVSASGALILPLALAPLYIFFRGKSRVRAFAWYAFMTTGASVLAAYLGTLFLEAFGWQFSYLLPGLLSVLALVLIFFTLPESYIRERRNPSAIAYAGGALVVLALISGIVQIGVMPGWSGPVLIVTALAATVGLALLFWWEIRTPDSALSDFSVKSRDLVMLITMGVLLQFILMGVFQPIFRYFSVVKEMGLWLRIVAIAPLFFGMLIGIYLAGRLWRRASVRRVFVFGLMTVAVSTAVLAIRPLTMPYWVQIVPLLLFGFAIQSTKTVWSNAFFQTVIDDFIGLNAAIQNATLQIGGTLGGLLGGQLVILFGYQAFASTMAPFASSAEIQRIYEIFSTSFGEAEALLAVGLPRLGATVWEQYVAAYASSYGWTLLVMACIAAGAAALAHFFLRASMRFTADTAKVDITASVFQDVAFEDMEDFGAALFGIDVVQRQKRADRDGAE